MCILALFGVPSLRADSTLLESAVLVTNSSATLDAGTYSAPTTADWDNDGSDDLLIGVGSSDSGRLYLYSNLESNMDRVFDGFFSLQSGGGTITDPADG